MIFRNCAEAFLPVTRQLTSMTFVFAWIDYCPSLDNHTDSRSQEVHFSSTRYTHEHILACTDDDLASLLDTIRTQIPIRNPIQSCLLMCASRAGHRHSQRRPRPIRNDAKCAPAPASTMASKIGHNSESPGGNPKKMHRTPTTIVPGHNDRKDHHKHARTHGAP